MNGYGFAYFRWRCLTDPRAKYDETCRALPMAAWRRLDYIKFGVMQPFDCRVQS